MGGLGTLTNLNFQLLNSGQANHVTSVPTVDGNTDRVVTIKCVQVGELAYLDSQCTGGRLLTSGRRLVFLWFFLGIRLITVENAHDLPSFCGELSVGVTKISVLALVLVQRGQDLGRVQKRVVGLATSAGLR